MTESIIVILPAHNEADNISQCIRSITDQSIKPVEIVVVLDRCSDGTEDRVDELAKSHPSIKKVVKDHTKYEGTFVKGQYIGESINAGLEQRSGDADYYMIMNADSILSPGYIQEAIKAFGDSNVGIVGHSENQNIHGTGYAIRSEILRRLNYQVIEYAGQDTHLQMYAMYLGYKIRNLEGVQLTLTRRTGQGSIADRVRYKFAQGCSTYKLGFSSKYALARSFNDALSRRGLTGLAIMAGYAYASLRSEPKTDLASLHIVKVYEKEKMSKKREKLIGIMDGLGRAGHRGHV